MKAFFNFVTSITLLLAILNVAEITQAQTATDLAYGVCSCDLMKNSCDLNCCCDNDCSILDKAAFLCPTETTSNQKWCVPNSMLFFSNTPYIIQSLEGLICIDINNSLALNYYTPVLSSDSSLSEDNVNQLVELYDPSISQQSLFNIELENKESFDSSDNVWTLFMNNVYGFLTLPTQVAGLECRDGPPVKYLNNKNSSCFTRSTGLTCAGLKDGRFSINYYIRNFKVLTKPTAIRDCREAFNPSDSNYYSNCSAKYLLPVEVAHCDHANGNICTNIDPSILQPTSSSNSNLCQNMVKKATYILKYNNPAGFTKAYLNLELFDVDLSVDSKLEQQFSVEFLPDSANHLLPIVESSGNPGYQLGKPLKVGNEWNIDKFLDFTILRSDSRGDCPPDNAVDPVRLLVKFRINTLSECKKPLSVVPTNLDMCKQLQAQIDMILLGVHPDKFYLPFATSTLNETNPIANYKPTTQPTFSEGVCQSLRTSVDLRIAYANEGNINNPQAKIVYFSYDWSELTDLRLRCPTQDCVGVHQAYLKLSSRVTFIDVSQPPLYTESQVHKPQAAVPDDFFYPLGFNSASQSQSRPADLVIPLVVILVYSLISA